jgi:hypothetical protein
MAVLRRSQADAASCHQFTQGGKTIRIAPLSFPKLGSDSYAIQAQYPAGTVDSSVVLVGNVIVQVFSVGSQPEPDLATRYAKRAVDRVANQQTAWMH